MLYSQDLEELIFNKHLMIECDEMVIISGYVGPYPVEKLGQLPIKATVIYGMYGCEGIKVGLHEKLKNINDNFENIDILYSTIPIHAKCYMWLKNSAVVYALIGSANFSVNGLTTPLKEILSDATTDTFNPLIRYFETIADKAIFCNDVNVKVASKQFEKVFLVDHSWDNVICSCPIYSVKNNDVQDSSGLNWGQSLNAHVNKNDSYIPITKDLLRNYPILFPEKQTFPRESVKTGKRNRHNDEVDILWDDGIIMKGLLEGTQEEDGKPYPNKFCSHPSKSELGKYIRNRISVPLGHKITLNDLDKYGRRTIDISLQGDGIYYFDFSIKSNAAKNENS